jgi:hypothetical protein
MASDVSVLRKGKTRMTDQSYAQVESIAAEVGPAVDGRATEDISAVQDEAG